MDSSGNAYVTGETFNGLITPFPTTANAYQTAMNGNGSCCVMDAFVAKFDTTSSGAGLARLFHVLGGIAAHRVWASRPTRSAARICDGFNKSPGYFTVNA